MGLDQQALPVTLQSLLDGMTAGPLQGFQAYPQCADALHGGLGLQPRLQGIESGMLVFEKTQLALQQALFQLVQALSALTQALAGMFDVAAQGEEGLLPPL
jgi:hypothetical protein